MVIGVTGGVGSGKSYVVDTLAKKLNATPIYTDIIAKSVSSIPEVNKKIEKIKEKYGDITLDTLANNELLRTELEKVIHSKTWNFVEDIISLDSNFIIETALPSNKFFEICDYTICVQSPYNDRVKRLKQNRNYSKDRTDSLIKTQEKYDEFYETCDISIDNSGTVEELERNIDEICKSRKWE